MRDTFLTASTVVLLLGVAAWVDGALAQMPVYGMRAPLQTQVIVNVCGSNGCVKVQTHKIQHQKPGSVGKNHI